MHIVIISDTHIGGRGELSDIVVPDGDLLIHCGDHTWCGTYEETVKALGWLDQMPHEHKVLIPGNHDFYFDERFPDGYQFRDWNIRRPFSVKELLSHYPTMHYLQDSEIEIEGFKIYGSPWQPYFHGWAFNFDGQTRGFKYPESIDTEKGLQQAKDTWAKIPDDVNILVTHCPPAGILDHSTDGHRLGDSFLRMRLDNLPNLRLHAFGHIHESYGRVDYSTENEKNCGYLTFVNAAICNGSYFPVNSPIEVDL